MEHPDFIKGLKTAVKIKWYKFHGKNDPAEYHHSPYLGNGPIIVEGPVGKLHVAYPPIDWKNYTTYRRAVPSDYDSVLKDLNMAPKKPSGSGSGSGSGSNISRKGTESTTTRKAKAKASKPMKQIFAGKVFSLSGEFGGEWTYEKVAGWIRAHGGTYEREVGVDTTHLISTIEAYNKKNAQVRKAWERGKQCHIVTKDWLEDCLIPTGNKKRSLPEKEYSLNRALKRIKDGTKKKDEYRKKFEEGIDSSREMMDNKQFAALHHIYVDNTGFEYKIVCTRINTAGKVKSEKYTIYLFESNAKPPHYMVGAKLTSPGRPPSYWHSDMHPKIFQTAYHDFMWFFQNITGIHWDDRLNGHPKLKDKFKYDVPKLGRPVGMLPPGKKAPTWDEDDEESEEGLVYDSDSEFEEVIENGTSKCDERPTKKPRLNESFTVSKSTSTKFDSQTPRSYESFVVDDSMSTKLINELAARQRDVLDKLAVAPQQEAKEPTKELANGPALLSASAKKRVRDPTLSSLAAMVSNQWGADDPDLIATLTEHTSSSAAKKSTPPPPSTPTRQLKPARKPIKTLGIGIKQAPTPANDITLPPRPSTPVHPQMQARKPQQPITPTKEGASFASKDISLMSPIQLKGAMTPTKRGASFANKDICLMSPGQIKAAKKLATVFTTKSTLIPPPAKRDPSLPSLTNFYPKSIGGVKQAAGTKNSSIRKGNGPASSSSSPQPASSSSPTTIHRPKAKQIKPLTPLAMLSGQTQASRQQVPIPESTPIEPGLEPEFPTPRGNFTSTTMNFGPSAFIDLTRSPN